MAYDRVNWKDHVCEKQHTYNITNNEDGTVTLTPVYGDVYQEGTDQSATNFNHMDEGIYQLDQGLIDRIYPVGSIYMSVNSKSPATFIGGVWERIKDTFLLAAGSSYKAGSTGGEEEHVLTISEMPSHTHSVTAYGYSENEAASADSKVLMGGTYRLTNSVNFATSNSGSKMAHNNMPPYLTVYMWKRVS